MSGHTPGPWMVTYTRNGTANVGPSHNCTVAALLIAPVGEMEANARLIAAAPMLLDGCRIALAVAESWMHDQLDGTSSLESALAEPDPVRAAIAAATGETK